MKTTEVFVGLGSNLGFPVKTLADAIEKLKALSHVADVKCSRFYETSPVGKEKQPMFINAVCSFKTEMNALALLEALQKIELELGKVAKPKDAPRVIDLDILFFGRENHNTKRLTIPHPCWKERLFVLAPLAELTSSLWVFEENKLIYKDIQEMIKWFPDTNQTVRVI